MSLLDRYITRTVTGNVLWLGPEATKQLQIELHALETEMSARVEAAEGCQNVVQKGGAQYCVLAEYTVEKLRDEIAFLKEANSDVRRIALERDALRKHADAVMEALHNYDIADGNANWQEGTALRQAARTYRTAFPKQP